MTRKLLLLSILLLTGHLASAQEEICTYDFFGFSDDLKYAAFEMYKISGTEGDSQYSVIYFIDVAKNDYAAPKSVQRTENAGGFDDAHVNANRQLNKKKSATQLQKLGITGKKLGTKTSFITSSDDRDRSEPEQLVTISNKKYKLSLVASDNPKGQEDVNTGQASQMFEVNLEKDGLKRVLQGAVPTPASWGHVSEYQLMSMYVIGSTIAVFVEYFSPGFEGSPERHQMIVSAVVDF